MYNNRVKKATYEELEEELLNPKLIVLNRPIKIPRFNMIENVENVNDVDFNDFDLDNRNIKTMLYARQSLASIRDKATQKDYEVQNHDLFPEMYEEIDATASVMGRNDAVPEARKLREMRTQTKRFTPKGFDTYSSANSSSGKPSSPPSPHHVSTTHFIGKL